ncbi:MAG: hypothetical protein IH851_09420 [Armatimonadetes bacterium]|nr:hypothetical protein [Armatimonadota bacterium]
MTFAQFTFDRFGEWVAALATLAVLSLLWKENPVYRVAEHLLLGLAVGFAFAVSWFQFLQPKWWDPWMASIADREWGGILAGASALALGLCWYGLYFKRTEWLMRLVLGVVIGASAGQAIRNNFTQQMPIVTSSFKSPIVIESGSIAWSASLNNTIFLLALITVLLYFFFSFEQTNPVIRVGSRIGRFWLMVGFGAFFGNTVMTRLAVLIERVWFVSQDFMKGFSQ